jgi:hypothetical protein
MNVEIKIAAAQFLFWVYTNGIFVAVNSRNDRSSKDAWKSRKASKIRNVIKSRNDCRG